MRNLVLFPTLIGAVMLSCSLSPVELAGGSTSTPNEVITGCAIFSTGDPAARTEVQLIPSSYVANGSIPSSSLPTDTTDESGVYCFTHVDTGAYNIQAVHLVTRTRALLTGIAADTDTVHVPHAVLEPAGNLLVILPDSLDSTDSYLIIPGTTIAKLIDSKRDTLVLDSVPVGLIPEIAYSSINGTTVTTIRYNILLTSGDTAVVRNPAWKYARSLGLNTSASGANVAGTVTDFPVLIRLNAGNFDFSQAHTEGGDLMFTGNGNRSLPREIERWDPVTELAEVWVKVDTVFGNNSSQSIIMYWGNSTTTPPSEDSRVFDTADGFQGVWHLNENADTLYDATPNRYHGIRHGTMNASSCMIGIGQSFGDSGGYVDMGNVLNPGSNSLTLSAWVKRSATGLQTIMAKSDGGDPNVTYGWSLSFHTADQLHFFAANKEGSWGSNDAFDCWSREDMPIVDTTWHYAVAVIDRPDDVNYRLYLDGEDITGGASGKVADLGQLMNSVAFRIGAEADDDYQFTGLIDECIVAFTARNEDWLRLCFINQGPDDRLVEFE